MSRRCLAVPAREQEQHRQRGDAPGEQGDHVERRFVRPVHVLEEEHGRPGRERELLEQEAMDLVRRGVRGERLLQLLGHASGEVVNRPKRPWDREVVTRADEHPRALLEARDETRHEGGLADPRLTEHDDDAALATRRRVARLGERGQRPLAFQQLHG